MSRRLTAVVAGSGSDGPTAEQSTSVHASKRARIERTGHVPRVNLIEATSGTATAARPVVRHEIKVPLTTEVLRALPADVTHLSVIGRSIDLDAQGLALLKRLNLTSIDFSRSHLSKQLLEALAQNPWLTHLDLSYTYVSDEALPILCRAASKLTHLSVGYDLTLRQPQGCFSGAGLKPLSNLKYLTHLDLTGHPIGSQGAANLARCPSLREAKLDKCGLGDEGIQALAANKGFESLGLAHNCLTAECAPYLAQLPSLKNLALESNRLGAKGAEQLGCSLSLEVIDLAGNGIKDEGLAGIAQARTLRDLTVARNDITDDGVEALTNLAPSLQRLDLSMNLEVTDRSAATLANRAHQLKHLDVGATRMSDIGLQQLMDSQALQSLLAEDLPKVSPEVLAAARAMATVGRSNEVTQ